MRESNSTTPYGLPPATIEKIESVFKKYSEIDRVIIYGSRAKGNYQKGSDIDLAVTGEKFTEKQLLELETRLDDLLLPYKIDLCRFENIKNPDLIDHIERAGKTLLSFS
mgnify:FL=1|jgi:predicted nucleotidyltransferase